MPRPETLLVSNFLSAYSSSAAGIESALLLRRRLVTVSAGVVPRPEAEGAAGALAYSMQGEDGSVVWDGGGGREGEVSKRKWSEV